MPPEQLVQRHLAVRRRLLAAETERDDLSANLRRLAGVHEKLEGEVASAKEALDSDDIGTIKGAFDTLTAASHKLAEVMYQSGDAADAGGEAAPSGDDDSPRGDDVIDAEYEDA